MKIIYLLLITWLYAPFYLQAQIKQGEIQFTEKINLHKSLDENSAAFKELIPEFRTTSKTLYFNSSVSSWRTSNIASPDTDRHIEEGGVMIKIAGNEQSDDQVFTNLVNNEMLDKRSFFGKSFLVKGTTREFQWKVSPEQKKILDFTCMKAVHEDSTQKISVWFSPEIPLSTGPARLGGLPGMILEADIDDGSRVIQAVSFSEGSPDSDFLHPPKKGKEVTEEEFKAITEEKMKEMMDVRGGQGVRVRIN